MCCSVLQCLRCASVCFESSLLPSNPFAMLSVLQYVAVCCSVLQMLQSASRGEVWCGVQVCCSNLQCAAVCFECRFPA